MSGKKVPYKRAPGKKGIKTISPKTTKYPAKKGAPRKKRATSKGY